MRSETIALNGVNARMWMLQAKQVLFLNWCKRQLDSIENAAVHTQTPQTPCCFTAVVMKALGAVAL